MWEGGEGGGRVERREEKGEGEMEGGNSGAFRKWDTWGNNGAMRWGCGGGEEGGGGEKRRL